MLADEPLFRTTERTTKSKMNKGAEQRAVKAKATRLEGRGSGARKVCSSSGLGK